jgi:5,5'-dehydrodivanillate O-demethylase
MFWQPVFRAEDLAPGRAKPIRVLGEDLTLYRGESGDPHCVAFRCAHRGTQLSTGWVEGDEIRCFYHGWKYGPDGQCTEQPAEPEPFCNRIRIRSYPVQEYLGLVFAYLGDDEPPAMPRFPEFEEEGVLEVMPWTVWPCNYFQRLENHVDEAHIAFVHRDSWYGANIGDVPQVAGEETEYGIRRFGTRDGDSQRMGAHMMPNILLRSAQPGVEGGTVTRDAVQWAVPVDDEHFYAPMVYITRIGGEEAQRYREKLAAQSQRGGSDGKAAAVLRGEVTKDEAIPRNVGAQDYVTQVGQGPIADRSEESLGRSDAVIVLLRTLWRRELRNLAEGRPIKRWTREGQRIEITAGAR